jgi:hypothetical protein
MTDGLRVGREATKTTGYIVIIEWDGGIPPTPYYHRLRKLTSGVRGDNELSAVARRAANVGEDKMAGLTLQEGAIITPSESLARSIAGLARTYGAPSVHIGEVSLTNYTHITVEDEEALKRVDTAYGQRGRPRKAHDWQVCCIECMATYFIQNMSYIPNCPQCGSFIIVTYPAKRPIMYEPMNDKVDLIDEWIAMCFGSGRFMIPISEELEELHSIKGQLGVAHMRKGVVHITDPADKQIVDMITGSPFVQHTIDTQPKDYVMDILNGIFASRRYYSPDHRKKFRIKAIMSIMADGFKGSIRMAERDDEVDLLDASSAYSAEFIKGVFYSTLQPQNA